MSDELDKFVLQYTVEMRDSIARLEKLNQKVEGVAKASKKTGSQIKDFAANATDEIGKLIPGLDKASGAIRMLGAGFAVAGVAVAALAIGIKAVMDMREQYNQQRKEGMDIGVSTLRLEEYQRKFVKQSGGHITREQTAAELKKLSEFSSAVYRDPTRVGTEARTAKVLGIDMGEPGKHTSVNSLMKQLGEKFQKMTDAQVQAAAKTLGMNQDFALSLKRQGGSVTDITELTADDMTKRKVAQESLDKFNDSFALLKESFNNASNVLGERLIPALTKLIDWTVKLADMMPSASTKVSKSVDVVDLFVTPLAPAKAIVETAMSLSEKLRDLITGKKSDSGKDSQQVDAVVKGAKDTAKDTAKTASKMKDMVDGEFDTNADAKRIADQQALSINQFAGAVASFSNAVDEKQAWAAWAGEVGRAAGINGPSGTGERVRTPPAQSGGTPNTAVQFDNGQNGRPMQPGVYDEYFREAGKRHGVDPNLLKNVARVESGFNPKAVSGVGATGLMQIMPANNKELGITDATDPKQSIMGGAKLLAGYLKYAKGDVTTALKMYHGGYDQTGWGKNTNAYSGKVLGAGQSAGQTIGAKGESPIMPGVNRVEEGTGTGDSRAKINLRSVQNTIAQRLGVPVQQLQQGGINRGDVSFANSQLQGGITNNIFDLKNQLKAVNLPQQTRSKMMAELQAQQTGLGMMRQYGNQVEDRAKPGERSITIGERAVVINVNGAQDPAATADAVQSQLGDHLGELVNGTATGMKL
jgi:Transglycosylase SLT domain